MRTYNDYYRGDGMKLSVDKLGNLKIATVTVLMLLLIIVMTGSASATITVESPKAGDNVSKTVTIRWNDTNGTAGPYNIYYITPNGYEIVIIRGICNTDNFTWDTTTDTPAGGTRPEDGIGYRIKVVNTSSKEIGVSGNFTIDNTQPSLEITWPEDKDVVGGTINVRVNVSDNLFLRNVTIELRDQNNNVVRTASNTTIEGVHSGGNTIQVYVTLNLSNVNDGSYRLIAKVYDMANNSASRTINITVDNTPPEVIIVKPKRDSYHRSNIIVEANVTDNNGVNVVYWTLINESGIIDQQSMVYNSTTGNYTAVIDITNLSDGDYTLYINASDIAQPANWNNETNVSIKIDKTPPTLSNATVRYPNGQNAAKNGDVVEINVTVTDNMAGIISVRANVSEINRTVGEVTLNNVAGTNYYNATVVVNTTDGRYNISIVALDEAGNRNTTIVTVIVDNTPPIIKIITPTSQSPIYVNNSTTFWINFTYIEENPMNYTVRVWNESGVVYERSATLNEGSPKQINVQVILSNATDGKYNITVIMYDNATNSNSTTEVYAVVVDNTPPTAPANLTATADKGAIILRWEPSSDNTGVEYYKIYRSTNRDVSPTNYDRVFTTTNTTFIDYFNCRNGTTYYYVVTAVDKAGNEGPASNRASATFIKGEPVKIVIIAPSQMTVGSSGVIQVRVLDKYNNGVPDEYVSFGTTAGKIEPAIAKTDENGIATAYLIAPTEVGNATITVYVINYTHVNNSTTVEFVPASYSDARVYTDRKAIPADGNNTTTIIVELTDRFGNLVPISGVQVFLTTTAGTFENGEQSIRGVTENGTFKAILRSSKSPTKLIVAEITANIAGVGEKRIEVIFYPTKVKAYRLTLSEGWQMISVPLESPIRCNMNLIAYTWDAVNKTYVRAEKFEPGKGYWVLSTRDYMRVTFIGSSLLYECEVNLTKGWNMIGTISYQVHLPTLVERYNLPILKVAYTWDPVEKTYVPAEILEPGKGYWILAYENTTLPLTPIPPSPPS